LVNYNPYRLFCSKVGMSAPGPKASDNKPAIQVLLIEFVRNFCSLLVGSLCILIIYYNN
jgi:hypothetical protein